MGLFKRLQQLQAVGRAAVRADAQSAGTEPPKHAGFAASVMSVMAQAIGPRIAATAPERGTPLPGSDDAVVDGSAWGTSPEAGVPDVRARDAAFDPGALVAFSDQLFAAIAAVWGGAHAATVRSVMSDDLWESLAAVTAVPEHIPMQQYLEAQRGQGRLLGVHAGASYDSALIGFHVTVDPAVLPPETPPGMGEWEEEWLLQRSAEPGGDPMIRPENCPTCGAPTDADPAGHCVHCHQPVPYLTAGWLVSRIVSHNPVAEMMHTQALAAVETNPEVVRTLPPALLRVLPADVQARLAQQATPQP